MTEVQPVFLVDPDSDPVAIKIVGRASFQNVTPLKDFLRDSTQHGKRCFVLDFSECSGMDSTVLGVMAGWALELRKSKPLGSLVLARLSERNEALVRNLGLHRIARLDSGAAENLDDRDSINQPLADSADTLDEVARARLCLEAHEKLVETDAGNQAKFQDVIAYLKNRVDEG